MDMAHIQLDRQFGLIYIADNSFRELKTRPQHQSCLKSIRRHLRPDGRLLITERRFNPALFANGRRELPWSEPLCDPRTGDLVQRRAELQLSRDGKWIHGRFLYRTIHSNGTETTNECPIDAPIFQTEDYLQLLSEAGFSTRVFVDYELREDDGKAPDLCFVCTPTG
jgi:SAM-dependent methyltransferase